MHLTNLFPLVVLCFFSLKTNPVFSQSLLDADTLVVNWEQLDGPPGPATQFEENDSHIFAIGADGLYSSVDQGLSWQYNAALGRKNLRYVSAGGSNVVVLGNDAEQIYPESDFSPVDYFQIYFSNNNGTSWIKLETDLWVDAEMPSWNYHALDFVQKNDSTLAFVYYYYAYPGTFIPKTYVSTNNGADWVYYTKKLINLTAVRDTFCGLYGEPLKGFYTNQNNFTNIHDIDITATGVTDQLNTKTAFVNGKFYIFKQDKTLWQTENDGQNWTSIQFSSNFQLPSDSILEVIITDSCFFLRRESGVFRGDFSQPDQLIQVYTGEEGWNSQSRSFAVLPSGYWVNTNIFQTIRSDDQGTNWKIASHGLVGSVTGIRSTCGKLLAYGASVPFSNGGNYTSRYFSDAQDQNWSPFMDLYPTESGLRKNTIRR